MKHKYWLLISFVYILSLNLIGCNNKNNGGTPPPPACPLGQVATPVGCTYPNNVVPPINYIAPNGKIQYFASKSDFMAPTDTLTPTDNYKNFLRDALGVCDRCTTSAGQASCNSWVSGFNMMMVSLSGISTTGHQIAFYSTPAMQQGYFQFSWQFPKIEDFFLSMFTGIAPPSCNPGQYSPYWATEVALEPKSTGFGLYVDHGPYLSRWNLYKFRVSIPQGKIGDPTLGFQLSVVDKNGNTADLATGTLTRCLSYC